MSVRYPITQEVKTKGDAIIHLAGKAHDLKKVSQPQEYYEANFELSKQLFDAFLVSDASVFIFMSTVKAVADIVDGTLTEGVLPNPKTHYGIDAKDGMVATHGWANVTDTKATELAKRFADVGVSSIVYTDIARDGMMQGVNVEQTVNLAREGGLPVIASGGVTDMKDIELLKPYGDCIEGIITGRAIYEGTLDLGEAQLYLDGK